VRDIRPDAVRAGLGCWSFGGGAYWGDCHQADADAVVRRAYELGINYFDAAEAYNAGRSEESLARRCRAFLGTGSSSHQGLAFQLLCPDAARAL